MCTLRVQALAQENSHSMQMKGFSPECVSMCFLRLPFSVHLYSHWLQLNGFSPIWTRMCCFRWTELADVKAHIGHLWGSSPPVFVLVLDALYNFRLFLSIKTLFISLSSLLRVMGWLKENLKNLQKEVTLEKVTVNSNILKSDQKQNFISTSQNRICRHHLNTCGC